MNREKVVCAVDLDNTSIHKSKDNLLENCNSGEHAPNIQNKEEAGDDNQDSDHLADLSVDVMTGSYGEISLDEDLDLGLAEGQSLENKESSDEIKGDGLDAKKLEEHCFTESKRPNSLVLTPNAKIETNEEAVETAEPWKQLHKSQQTSDSQATSVEGSPSLSSDEFAICSSRHHRTGSDTSGLSDLQGTITVDGDMVSFFAEDLQEKIKLSSPLSKWADSSFPGSRSSTPSLHLQLNQVPLVDAGAVAELEDHAKNLASCINTMLENLSGTLQSISSLTVDYMETYESAVCKTCDSVDMSIKTMYQLVAKCEELSNSVKPIYQIAQDVKHIKKLLDSFEVSVERKNL